MQCSLTRLLYGVTTKVISFVSVRLKGKIQAYPSCHTRSYPRGYKYYSAKNKYFEVTGVYSVCMYNYEINIIP